ncbi:MAG: hypothetical protein ACYDB6_07260 [Candidatus Limnocylindrales bacterium]
MATRTCSGSKTFGIESHEAPIEEFPVQPSRRDGLGTMCKPHWTEYTRALRRAAAGKKPEPARPAAESPAATTLPIRTRRPSHEAKLMRSLREQLEEEHVIAPARPASESAAVKSRRAKLEAELAAAGGAGTEAGQQILEDADVARASGLLLAMSEPLTVEEAG